ncbi:Ig-like domain-containing protein [Niabella pedocola]|uniref:Ig-like domain-containing protein n=1 Tax=Niabella pedocola TaxID=1752077 RepID=A0ABS8PXV2_9BACT|nr:Ig-like domain-containing protein [Niabella pedocola]MCD2425117.1 Ig-like domain-containing protein [Niabella pedocola]
MNTNLLLRPAIKPAVLFVLLMFLSSLRGYMTYAQVTNAAFNTYEPLVLAKFPALTVAKGNSGLLAGNFQNEATVIDNDVTNTSSWQALLSVLSSAWVEVHDPLAVGPNAYPAGSYAGFVIGTGTLLDITSNIKLETFLGATLQETYNASNGIASVSLLGGGKGRVGFVTAKSFDRIRITFSVTGIGTTRRVYHAEILRPQAGPAPACNVSTPFVQNVYPATVSTGTTGLSADLLGQVFSNIENVVDPSTANSATITMPNINVLASAHVAVRNAGSALPAGYFAGFIVSNASLASGSLISNSKVTTYLDGIEQESATGNSLMLSLPVLTGSSQQTLGFATTKAFDEIRYTISQPVGVNIGETQVYAAVIKRFCAGTLQCNTLTRMNANVQQPVYVDMFHTGINNVACASCAISGMDAMIDGNANTYATMTFTASIGVSGSVAVRDAVTTYAVGTFAGFDVETNTLLNINALNAATVQLLKEGVVVQSGTGNALIIGGTSNLLTGTTRQTVGLIANTEFDEVKLTFSQLAGGDLGNVKIYDAVWQKNCAGSLPCNTTVLLKTPEYGVVIDGARTGITGAACAACKVGDAWNLVNANPTDYANIQLIAGIGTQGSIAVADGANTYPAGSFAGFMIRDNNGLLFGDLLSAITITTYNNGAQVESKSASQLIGLTVLLPIFNNYGVRNVGFITTQPYDEIRFTVNSLGTAIRNMDVFNAVIDTRYVVPGTPGLNCSVFKTSPDINYTTINKPVTGSLETNDQVPSGTTYTNAVPVNGADGQANPANATINLNSNGTYTFSTATPGIYSYSTTICTGSGNCEVQNLTVSVTDPGSNANLPVVNTDATATNTGKPVTVAILANDHGSNPGGTLGTPVVSDAPTHGTAAINGNNTLTYTPEAGFVGKDTITYTVCENPGNKCGQAYVIVDVRPVEINSTAAADDYNQTLSGTAVSGNIKTNDVDPEGDPQSITPQNVTNSYGTFVQNTDGSYTFTPAAGFAGTAQFKYNNADNKGAVANATLYVYTKGSGAEGNGLTNPDINYTTVNKPVTGSVASNDQVPSGTTLTYSNAVPVNGADGQPNPSGATINLNPNGDYTFSASAIGVYSYNVTACTGGNACEAQNLTITVTDTTSNINPPVANTDIATTNMEAPVNIKVLVNDHSSNGGTLGTPVIVDAPSSGTASVNPDKTVTYVPATGFTGKDSLTYSICETPGNKCSVAYVIIDVKPAAANTTTASDDFAETIIGTAVTGNVKTNDMDAEGDPQAITTQNVTNSYGTFVLNADGTYTYTPATGFIGTAQFTYTNTDSKGAKALATLYINVKGSVIDLSISILAEPTQVVGAKAVGLRVTTYTTNGNATTTSPVYILIAKSPNFTLEAYNPSLSTINGQPVQNADWEYVGVDANNVNYVFKLGGTNQKQTIAGASASIFGITVSFNAGSTSGSDNILARIFGGSGGESIESNNTDTETIKYTPSSGN